MSICPDDLQKGDENQEAIEQLKEQEGMTHVQSIPDL